jgi:hypothetical protein
MLHAGDYQCGVDQQQLGIENTDTRGTAYFQGECGCEPIRARILLDRSSKDKGIGWLRFATLDPAGWNGIAVMTLCR